MTSKPARKSRQLQRLVGWSVDLSVRFRGARKWYAVTATVQAESDDSETIMAALTRNPLFGNIGKGCGQWLPSPLEEACANLEPFICGDLIADSRIVSVTPNAPRDLRGDSRVTVHADVGGKVGQ